MASFGRQLLFNPIYLRSDSGRTLRLRKIAILASNLTKDILRETNLLVWTIVAAAEPFDSGNTQNEQNKSAEWPIESVSALNAGQYVIRDTGSRKTTHFSPIVFIHWITCANALTISSNSFFIKSFGDSKSPPKLITMETAKRLHKYGLRPTGSNYAPHTDLISLKYFFCLNPFRYKRKRHMLNGQPSYNVLFFL